jgi:hypothetical protein
MAEVDFKFGTLIRTGPKLANGGKWDADLAEWAREKTTNADPTIYIRVLNPIPTRRSESFRQIGCILLSGLRFFALQMSMLPHAVGSWGERAFSSANFFLGAK